MKKTLFFILLISSVFLSGCVKNIPSIQTKNSCDIKGNINTQGDKVYHLKTCLKYNEVSINLSNGDKWFCSEDEAKSAGWTKSKNCPQ